MKARRRPDLYGRQVLVAKLVRRQERLALAGDIRLDLLAEPSSALIEDKRRTREISVCRLGGARRRGRFEHQPDRACRDQVVRAA
jgi:hypothetical protein